MFSDVVGGKKGKEKSCTLASVGRNKKERGGGGGGEGVHCLPFKSSVERKRFLPGEKGTRSLFSR